MSRQYVVHSRRDRTEAPERNIGKWLTGLAFFVALCAMFTSLTVFQASSEGPARRAHVRAIVALTEIDTLLARNFDDLQDRAGASQPGETLLLRDHPIEIPLTRDEALASDKPALRALLIARSADVMYAEGTGALRDAQGADSVGRFTAAGAVDRMLDLLRKDVHDAARVVTYVLAALCIFLAVTLASLTRGFGRLGSVGVVLLLASLLLLAAAEGARLSLQMAGGSDAEYVRREMLDIGVALSWIAVRNGVAFTALGLVLVATAELFGRIAPDRGNGASATGLLGERTPS